MSKNKVIPVEMSGDNLEFPLLVYHFFCKF
jgi:hypothetical protein